MASGIENAKDMAYVGKVPWHGLGSVMPSGAPLEEWAIAANMNWQVEEAPVLYYDDTTSEVIHYEGRKVLVRSDTREQMAIVSSNYQPVHPTEVLEFFRDLVEGAGFEMETAGILFGGRKFWALAKLGKDVTLPGGDELNGYLMLATAIDLSMSTTGAFTATRVVCDNTLQMAYNGLEDSDPRYYMKVPHNVQFNPDYMKAQLGLADNAWSQFTDRSKELAQRKVTDLEAFAFMQQIMGDMTKDLDHQPTRLKTVLELFKGKGKGSDLASADGTAWGLVNAVTEFADHHRNAKSLDSRMDSSQFGIWAKTKHSAFEEALKLVA
jgi:phage/plasmid-like protein (TIGR03299 family)